MLAVGFSAATGGGSELHQIHSWSFNSTMAVTEGFNGDHPEQGSKGRHGQALVIGGLVILALVLLLATWSTLSWWKLKHKLHSFDKERRVRQVEYKDLSIATNKFSNERIIGKGSFGVVYKGDLGGRAVAVKKILQDSQGKFKDFLAELGTIGETGHRNVVRLEGWCCSISNFMFWCFYRQKVHLFIVYELVPNGDLHQHLYDRPEVLSWAKRFKIVKDLYAALNYLHFGCAKYILHRDIKPSNILLDHEFNAKLGDFGLSRAAERIDATSVGTEIAAGTKLYMDPLGMTDTKANFRRSSDVYSFGIVLLEIAHGKYDADLFQNLHIDQPNTFVEDFADEKLNGQFDKAEMERVIILGLRCSDPVANKRPSLDGATLQFLENGGELRAATIHEDEPHPAATATAHV